MPQGAPPDPARHFQQAIRRWGNSLAVRLPADCLRQLDRAALAADLHQLQSTMPLTPSVMEECRSSERW